MSLQKVYIDFMYTVDKKNWSRLIFYLKYLITLCEAGII